MNNNYLVHHGVKGMKWGVRRHRLRGALARRQNKKIDKSFKKWQKGSQDRQNAIELGKARNALEAEYLKAMNSDDGQYSKEQLSEMRSKLNAAEKQYTHALKSNTTYRKGQVKHEVYSDMARKYLSEAKKANKKYSETGDKRYKKIANAYSEQHAILRSKARRAPEVSANRSRYKAGVKSKITITAKAAAFTGAAIAGTALANKYLKSHNVIIKGKRIVGIDGNIIPNGMAAVNKIFKGVRNVAKYI